MGEFQITDQGQLDLGVDSVAGGGRRSAAEPPEWSQDDWVDQGWVPGDYGDPESDPDDYEAWLAGLPADVRAEFLAGAWTGDGEVIPAGFLHHMQEGPSGVGFAAGGVLDSMVPGPWLADAIAAATAEGHAKLGESELIGVLCAWRRISSWAAAGEAAAVIALARRRAAQACEPGTSHLDDHTGDEIAAALTLTGRSAGRLLTVGSGLARLEDVLAALKRGQIDWAKAALFVDELAVLEEDSLARDIAARLLGRAGAGGWTTGQLRAGLRRAVLAADPTAADRRRAEARKDAEVQAWDEPSGNAGLAGRELPPAEVLAADARLTALAKWLQERGAVGTISQLRAAVYTALLSGRPVESLLPAEARDDASSDDAASGDTGSGDTGSGDAPAGRDAPADGSAAWPAVSGTIHLTMPLSAWLGGDQPGDVAGHGPVDAATSRALAAMLADSPATKWSLTVTGADGRAVGHASAARGPASDEPVIRWVAGLRERLQILESGTCRHGRQSGCYQPPALLRNIVMVRQRTCCFPGCRRSARRCDVDHTLAFDKGGRTCECNLAPLCRRHHQAKQATRWHLTQDQPGHMTWHLPSGRVYETVGDPY
jgi:hypothetical protein